MNFAIEHSFGGATRQGMALDDGRPTQRLYSRIRNLASLTEPGSALLAMSGPVV